MCIRIKNSNFGAVLVPFTALPEDLAVIVASYTPDTFQYDRKTILWADRPNTPILALTQGTVVRHDRVQAENHFPRHTSPRQKTREPKESKARIFNPDAHFNGILFRQLIYNLFLDEWRRHFRIKCLDPHTGSLEVVEPTSISVTSESTKCKEHQQNWTVCAVETVKALGVTLKLADCVTHPLRYRLAPLVVLQRVSEPGETFRNFVCLGKGVLHMVEKASKWT